MMLEPYYYNLGTAYLCDDHYVYGDSNMAWGLLIRLTKDCRHCKFTHTLDD